MDQRFQGHERGRDRRRPRRHDRAGGVDGGGRRPAPKVRGPGGGMRPGGAGGAAMILSGTAHVRTGRPCLSEAGMRSAGHARPQWDPWLLGGALALMLLGVIMVHSASVAYAQRVTGNSIYYLTRHLGHVLLGLLLLGAVMHTRVRWWEKAGPYLLLLGIGLFVAGGVAGA